MKQHTGIGRKAKELLNHFRMYQFVRGLLISLCLLPILLAIVIWARLPVFLILIPLILIILLYISDRGVLRMIKKDCGDEGNRLYHALILKSGADAGAVDFEILKLYDLLMQRTSPVIPPFWLFRAVYIQIFFIIAFSWLLTGMNTGLSTASFVRISPDRLVYNRFTADPVRLNIHTYGDAIEISISDERDPLFKQSVNNSEIELPAIERSPLIVTWKGGSKEIPVEFILPLSFRSHFHIKRQGRNLEPGDRIPLEGETLHYKIEPQGDYDTFVLTVDGNRSDLLASSIIPFNDCEFLAYFYKSGYLAGKFYKRIPIAPNSGPSVKITKPLEDVELDGFYGDYELRYEITDPDGIYRVEFAWEKESGGIAGIRELRVNKGSLSLSGKYMIPLERITDISDSYVYIYIRSFDGYGKEGRSRKLTLSLMDNNALQDIWEEVGSTLFGELEMMKAEPLDGGDKKFDPKTSKSNELTQEIQKRGETIEKTMEYLEAALEELKVEKKIIEQVKRQQELMKELLNKEVLDLLRQKMEQGLDSRPSSQKVSQADLEKISWELERIIKQLEEYKKGLDAARISKKLDQLEQKQTDKLDEIKSDVSDLFSRFDKEDEKLLDPDKARNELSKMNQKMQQKTFEQSKKKLSSDFKDYSADKLNNRSNSSPDLSPLVEKTVALDVMSHFTPEMESWAESNLAAMKDEMASFAAILMMFDHSLHSSFQNTYNSFQNYRLKKEQRYFSQFKNSNAIFLNKLIVLMDRMDASSCSSGSSMNLFEKLNSLSQDQQKLNSYLEKMMEQYRSSGMNKRMSDAVKQAADKQQELQERLSKLSEDIKESKEKGELAGTSGKIEEKMEAIKEALRKEQLSDDLVDAGRRVAVELLELQRAVYSGKKDNTRISRIGRFIQKWYPDLLNDRPVNKEYHEDYLGVIRSIGGK